MMSTLYIRCMRRPSTYTGVHAMEIRRVALPARTPSPSRIDDLVLFRWWEDRRVEACIHISTANHTKPEVFVFVFVFLFFFLDMGQTGHDQAGGEIRTSICRQTYPMDVWMEESAMLDSAPSKM